MHDLSLDQAQENLRLAMQRRNRLKALREPLLAGEDITARAAEILGEDVGTLLARLAGPEEDSGAGAEHPGAEHPGADVAEETGAEHPGAEEAGEEDAAPAPEGVAPERLDVGLLDRLLKEAAAAVRAARDQIAEVSNIVVRQYALGQPLDWDDECEAQMRAQNTCWNRLVETDGLFRERFVAVSAEDSLTHESEAALTGALLALGKLKDQKKILRQKLALTRRKLAGLRASRASQKEAIETAIADLTAAINVLAGEIADQKKIVQVRSAAAKAARKAARQRRAPEVEAIKAARKAALDAAVKESGLWWCNANAVRRSFDKACERVVSARSSGTAARLNFHRWTGEGRLVNQIIGGMTVDELYAGEHSQVAVLAARTSHLKASQPPAGQRRPDGRRMERRVQRAGETERWPVQRMTLRATVFTVRDGEKSRRKDVHWPILIDWPLPPDVIIKEVAVHRRKLADQTRWTATFLCRQPKAPASAPATETPGKVPRMAIWLNWRRVNDGLRVATIQRADSEEVEYLTLPDDIMAGAWLDAQKSHRDRMHNAIIDKLRALPWHAAPPPLAAEAARWQAIPLKRLAPRHTVRLVMAWRSHADWWPEACAAAEDWRKADKRAWQRIVHRSRRAIGARREIYRIAAKRFAAEAAVIVINKPPLAEQSRQKGHTEYDAAAKERQALRRTAGLSVLRTCLANACEKAGTRLLVRMPKKAPESSDAETARRLLNAPDDA